MQQAYTEGHYLERLTPYWAYVTAFSQNGLFLDYPFAGNRLLELAWVIRSMKREEKNSGPMRGRLHIKTTQILCKFFTLAKKFAGERIIVLFFELSSSQESSSTQPVKVRKGNFSTQD